MVVEKIEICPKCEIDCDECSCYFCDRCGEHTDSFHDIRGDAIICCKCFEANREDYPQPPCILCGEPIDIHCNGWAEGHNAQPLADGRCCSTCNKERVVPRRIANIFTGWRNV